MNTSLIWRGLQKLKLSKVMFSATNILTSPKAKKGSIDQSIRLLNSFSPDNGSSCIRTEPAVLKEPEFDLQIIVPVYNVEKYIVDCIESILSQKTTFSFIITVINDGSPDNSRELLKRYEGNPKVEIIDQENRGFSGARNRGLENLRGRYITFVDSDDRMAPNAIQSLMERAVETNSDIVQGSYITIDLNNGKTGETLVPSQRENARYFGITCTKAFKRELFQLTHFPENYWFEDTAVAMIWGPMASRIASTSDIVYEYRMNPTGISATAHKSPRVLDSLWITKRLFEDRNALNMPLTDKDFRNFLHQIAVNERRIASFGRKDIEKAAFDLSIELREKYFQGFTTTNKALLPMQTALEKRSFLLYKLASFYR